MGCIVYSFADYAAEIGYRIAETIPVRRDHLPPISAWVDVYDPEGRFVGAGIVIAHDPDPAYIVVQVDGARCTVHWTDCDWAMIGGGASCP